MLLTSRQVISRSGEDWCALAMQRGQHVGDDYLAERQPVHLPSIAAGSLDEREVGNLPPPIRAVRRLTARHNQRRRLRWCCAEPDGPVPVEALRPDEERSLVGLDAEEVRLEVV